jgi:hypothetical protein
MVVGYLAGQKDV